jgi:leader peptidase (prepilin peptidase)/N-methyltransferase
MLLFFHVVIYGGFAWGAVVPVWIGIGLALVLIWISVVDIERFEIPDAASAVLFISGGAYVLLWPDVPVLDHLLGVVIWPLMFWLVGVVYLCWRGVHGLGFGDVKLIAGIALWIGFQGAVLVVLAASLAGIAVLLVYMVVRRGKMAELGKSAVAFGPFLCLSAWVVWLQGVSP